MSTGCDGEMFNDRARSFVGQRNRKTRFTNIAIPHMRDSAKHITQGHSTQYDLSNDPVSKFILRNNSLIHQYKT
jgi:hypothetical protein